MGAFELGGLYGNLSPMLLGRWVPSALLMCDYSLGGIAEEVESGGGWGEGRDRKEVPRHSTGIVLYWA